MENSQEQFEKAEVFNSPQDLMASMASDSQQSEPQSEPQVEAQPEPQPEQPQESAYVDPEAAPAEEPTTLEQITEAAEPQVEPQQDDYQQPQEENYSDEEIEAVNSTLHLPWTNVCRLLLTSCQRQDASQKTGLRTNQ
jgi:hypothetical protein